MMHSRGGYVKRLLFALIFLLLCTDISTFRFRSFSPKLKLATLSRFEQLRFKPKEKVWREQFSLNARPNVGEFVIAEVDDFVGSLSNPVVAFKVSSSVPIVHPPIYLT